MCAIAAIFSYSTDAPPVDHEELLRIREAMRLRGPDGAGEWHSANRRVGLAHRRLSIIDLSGNGAQPMLGQDGLSVIAFNGEIYDYRELRAGLEQKGYLFRSQSDTEVLLHLYDQMGPGMVEKLCGMYAFVIWDQKRNGIFLARDPFGIKPLYYSDNGKTFRAASQVKALLAGGAITTTMEPAGHVGFFLWGSVPEPYSLYKEIRSVPAGTTLWLDAQGNKQWNSFCQIPKILAAAERAPGDVSAVAESLETAMTETVRRHLVADVPVGIFLSSGLDSTTLAALAAQEAGQIRTVTLGFEEFRGTSSDETPLAEMMARQLNAVHQTIWVTRSDFRNQLEDIFTSMDQPSIDGINSYFVSLAASRASLKVALSGLGGDELFGGYPSFKEIPRLVGVLEGVRSLRSLGPAFRVLANPVLKRTGSPKYSGLLEYGTDYGGAYLLRRGLFMPWELADFLNPELVREGLMELRLAERLTETLAGLTSSRLKISSLEICWYMRNQLLRDCDWASMAHSLEIRLPLVDIRLLKAIAPKMGNRSPPGKNEMACTPLQKLPEAILLRPKTGFGIPVRDWFGQLQPAGPRERGLRGWSKSVYSRFAGIGGDQLKGHESALKRINHRKGVPIERKCPGVSFHS